MSGPNYRRRKRLIKPRLQWKLIGSFIGILVLGMLLQYLLLAQQLTKLAGNLSSDGAALLAQTPGMLSVVFLISFGVLLPITVAVGVSLTFRIAGPVYRFEQHLGAIARGEQPGNCKLREGDELMDLCEVLNSAVDALRNQAQGEEADRVDPVTDSAELRRVG